MKPDFRELLSMYGAMDRRKLIGLLLGPALLVLITTLHLPLTRPQQSLLGVLALTITYWTLRPLPLPVTSILALALTVVMDAASGRRVFSAFSSPTLFLLIGSFILTQSMVKYGLGHRMALRVLALPGIASSTYRIVIAFGALAALLSAVVDNGALAAMLLPVGLGLIRVLDDDIRARGKVPKERRRLHFGTALLLMTAYGATVGALLTPFGDAANLVGWQFIRDNHMTIDLGTWILLAGPVVLVLFAVLATAVLLVNRPEVARIPTARRLIAEQRHKLGPISRGERNTGIAFGFAVFLWLLPPLVGLVAGTDSVAYLFLNDRLHPAVVAILAACLLFMLPAGEAGQLTLRWRDAKLMDWGPVLLVGSALALGKMMEHTGLAEVMGRALASRVGELDSTIVYLLCAGTALMISELSTNLVSVSVVLPLLPTVTQGGAADSLTAALATTFAAIYGFMLPISTSANAIVYSSGRVPFSRMVLTGVLVDITGIFVIVTGVTTMLSVLGIR